MKLSLKIGWMYPDLMSIYGDRGNIITLRKRCEWRGIETTLNAIDLESTNDDLSSCDLLFMGGAQDKQQTIVSQELLKKKKILTHMVESGVPGLYICGAYQFLGNYYKEADGTTIKGLGIFDLYTENPGSTVPRLIGNIGFMVSMLPQNSQVLVGFENHGGRTYLGNNIHPLGNVVRGYGNNGKDGLEGAVYKNSIGSYAHGPLLPKNPELADWLIKKAIAIKYNKEHNLLLLDDTLAAKAREAVLQKKERK